MKQKKQYIYIYLYSLISLILDITSSQFIHEVVDIFSLRTFPWSVGLDHQMLWRSSATSGTRSNRISKPRSAWEVKLHIQKTYENISYTNMKTCFKHFLRVSSFLSFRCSSSFQIHNVGWSSEMLPLFARRISSSRFWPPDINRNTRQSWAVGFSWWVRVKTAGCPTEKLGNSYISGPIQNAAYKKEPAGKGQHIRNVIA